MTTYRSSSARRKTFPGYDLPIIRNFVFLKWTWVSVSSHVQSETERLLIICRDRHVVSSNGCYVKRFCYQISIPIVIQRFSM